MADKALVLLSGGLDSATCLYWAKDRFSEVAAMTFNYYGRIENERCAAKELAKSAEADVIEIDIPFVKELSDRTEVKKYSRKGLWSSYVPARNMIFYSIAAHHAEFLKIRSIVAGHNSHDGDFFKDASKRYIGKLNALLNEGCLLCDGSPYRIVLPLAKMKRKEIIRLALRLKTPIGLTWSCHKNGSFHCGKCYACRQRIEAFSSLRIPDPAFAR